MREMPVNIKTNNKKLIIREMPVNIKTNNNTIQPYLITTQKLYKYLHLRHRRKEIENLDRRSESLEHRRRVGRGGGKGGPPANLCSTKKNNSSSAEARTHNPIRNVYETSLLHAAGCPMFPHPLQETH